ncbi:MAG: hypothetical protein AAF633_24690, partial [Chloroflexota bacterium]
MSFYQLRKRIPAWGQVGFAALLLIIGVAHTAEADQNNVVAAASNSMAIGESSIFMEIIQPTAVDIETCYDWDEAFEDTFTFDNCKTEEDAEAVVVEVADLRNPDRKLMANITQISEVFFAQLPTLPDNVEISEGKLILEGEMHGNDFEVEVFNADDALIYTAVIAHDGYMYGPENCYNRHQSGGKCEAARFQNIVVEIPLPGQMLADWYNGGTPSVRLAPTDMVDGCTQTLNSVTSDDESAGCLFLTTVDPILQIEYVPNPLGFSAKSGDVPSVNPAFFSRTAHEYELDAPIVGHEWSVIGTAVIDDSFLVDPDGSVPLNVRTNFEIDRSPVFDQPSQGHSISYAVIDHSIPALLQNEWVEVNGFEENNPNSRYLVNRFNRQVVPNPTSTGTVIEDSLSNSFLDFYVFDTEPGSNLYISMTAPTNFDISMELFPNAPGQGQHNQVQFAGRGDGFQMNAEPRDLGNLAQYILEAPTESAEEMNWALVVPHERPECLFEGDGGEICTPITIELISCPAGSYFTEKWGCQDLIYPHTTLFPEVGATTEAVPATARRLVGDVAIFSEGGFDDSPSALTYGLEAGNYSYCTMNEDLGMPLLGTSDDSVPLLPAHSPPETLIAVRQGSVCVTNGDDIVVTGGQPEYGAITGPSIREASSRPAPLYELNVSVHFGKMLPAFGTLYDQDGMMSTSGSATLVPDPDTTQKFDPWDWGGDNGKAWPEMTSTSRIEIDQYAVVGTGTGAIEVTSNTLADRVPVGFDSSWIIDGSFAQFGFNFNAETGTIPSEFNVASLAYRTHTAPDIDTTFANQNPRVRELTIFDATVHQS